MRTAVISDLHLGARTSLVAGRDGRDRLLEGLDGVDQLVLLGDVLAMRAGPVERVLRSARPLFEELGEALAGRSVVVVPGNHDYQVVAPLLEARRRTPHEPGLGLAWMSEPKRDGVAGALAGYLGRADLVVAYPGFWIRADVYATHGHYLDCHLSVPRLESILTGVTKRLTGDLPQRARPEDYERVVEPVYAFLYSLAQGAYAASDGARSAGVIPRRLRTYGWYGIGTPGAVRPPATRLVSWAVVRAGVAALNAARVGRFSSDLSVNELSRAGRRAMAEVVSRLEIEAEHVVFGHTHRAGPSKGEPPWRVANGVQLVNAGNWAYAPELVGDAGGGSPFWPGTCVYVDAAGPPVVRRLVEELPARLAAFSNT